MVVTAVVLSIWLAVTFAARPLTPLVNGVAEWWLVTTGMDQSIASPPDEEEEP